MRHVWEESLCAFQRGGKTGWAMIMHRWWKSSWEGGETKWRRPVFGFPAWQRFKKVKTLFSWNSFLGDQVLLQTIGLFFNYCESIKDSMQFLFRSNGMIGHWLSFISAQISRLGFNAIHNFCSLCCETKYLTRFGEMTKNNSWWTDLFPRCNLSHCFHWLNFKTKQKQTTENPYLLVLEIQNISIGVI